MSQSTIPPVRPTLLHRFVAVIGALYLHLVGRTSFVERWDDPRSLLFRRKRSAVIYAFWHNAQVFLSYHHRYEPVRTVVSRSQDGEYIAQVMKWMGMEAVRGSKSKGGDLAMRELITILDNGGQAGFTPDGPRGPLHTVHGGVVMAAQVTGLPIVPTNVVSRRRLIFNSWDKFMVPLPFSAITVAHGRPIQISKEISEDEAKKRIQEALNENVAANVAANDAMPGYGALLVGSLLHFIYNVFSTVLVPIWLPVIVLKYGFKRAARGWRERFGFEVPERAADEPLFLFHAASLGEWQALKPLFSEMKVQRPHTRFVVTTSAPEVKTQIAAAFPECFVSLVPLDLPWIVRPWIKRLRPSAAFIVETELWPNLITGLYNAFVPVVIVNGRLSDRSVRSWGLAKPFMQRLLRRVSMFYVRTPADAENFKTLGAPVERVQEMGNLKIDNLHVISNDEKRARRTELWGNVSGPVIVAGSTWGVEEKTLLDVRGARLVIAPRRPERFDEVARLLESSGRSFSRWSKIKGAAWTTDILLVDTLGDLGRMYQAADVAFIGGSLEPRGGQNPLEAAAARVPSVFGPSMHNFKWEAAALVRSGAAVQSADAVASLNDLIQNESRRRTMGDAAARFVEQNQGVAKKQAALLNDLIGQ